MEAKIDQLITMTVEYAPKLVLAIIVLIIGLWIINKLVSYLEQAMLQSNMDADVIPFLKSLVGVLLKVMLLFSVAELVGIKTTSFVALIAAAGFAVGMALQGSLGNFASGVMILFFKPYKVGDLIETDGQKGWVQEIQIFNTILKTPTNQCIIIPNSVATSGTIINHSVNGHIRLDIFSAIPYAEDFNKVEAAILSEVDRIPEVLDDPEPQVGIQEFDSHNIKIGTFVYVYPEKYWPAYYAVHKAIKKALGKSEVKMAYSEGIELGKIGVN